MSETFEPHPMNAPGPFYVADGYCMRCGLPFQVAPDLFAWCSDSCYVKKQPDSKEEAEAMLEAMWVSEVQCIRYRGQDPEILRRLAERDDADLCDIPPPANIRPLFRNVVTFDASSREAESLSSRDLALAFQQYLRSRCDGPYEFTEIVAEGSTATFSFCWYEKNFHPVEIHAILMPDCRWLVRDSSVIHHCRRGVSNIVAGWLMSDARFCNVRWYTEEQWNGSKEWQETPI